MPPVEGLDTFEEASGTKALKPDLEAAVALPGGAVLALGSGSTAARMRSVLVAPDGVAVGGRPDAGSTPGWPRRSAYRPTS